MAKQFKLVVNEDGTIPAQPFVLKDGSELMIDPSGLSPEMRERAMWHGLLQKIGDSAAKFSNGKGTAEEAANEQRLVWEAIAGGDWERRGGRGASVPTLTVESLIVELIEKAIASVNKARLAEFKKAHKPFSVWVLEGERDWSARFKRDFRKEAEAELKKLRKMAEEIDLSDI